MVIENLIDHSFMNWMNNGHFDKKKSFWSYKGHFGHTTVILINKVILVIHRSFWWWSKYHFGHKLHCHFGHTTVILVKKGYLKKITAILVINSPFLDLSHVKYLLLGSDSSVSQVLTTGALSLYRIFDNWRAPSYQVYRYNTFL